MTAGTETIAGHSVCVERIKKFGKMLMRFLMKIFVGTTAVGVIHKL